MIMKKHVTLLLALSFLLAVSCGSQEDDKHQEKAIGWATAMLTTIEAEHLTRGDSVHLSSAYVLRMMIKEKAVEYYRTKGEKAIDVSGTAPLLIHYIYRYGVQPYDSYEGKKDVRYDIVCKKIMRLCDTAIVRRVGEEKLEKQVDDLLDSEMGYLPGNFVHMLGAEYTPQEFAHSVCYPGEYIALSKDKQSSTEILSIVMKALRYRHPVCFEFEDGQYRAVTSLDDFSQSDVYNCSKVYMSKDAL